MFLGKTYFPPWGGYKEINFRLGGYLPYPGFKIKGFRFVPDGLPGGFRIVGGNFYIGEVVGVPAPMGGLETSLNLGGGCPFLKG